MSSLLYMTDGHSGPIIPASSPSGFTLYGDQAPLLRCGIQDFAQQQNIFNILDGGDQNTFEEPGENFSDFRSSTRLIMDEFNGQYYVLNGNHGVNASTGQFYEYRSTELITNLNGFESTALLLVQPRYIWGQNTTPHFCIDDDPVLRALDEVDSKNLMIGFHWSLQKAGTTVNTSGRKSPSLQGDFTDIQNKIDETARRGINVLVLSGHSHCFAYTVNESGTHSLTMPSFVQHDVQDQSEPCGLTSLIEETREGLSVSFKKTVINPGLPKTVSPARLIQRTEDVDVEYMERYAQRPFVPPARRGLAWR